MAHIAKRDQFMNKGQCLIIAGNYLFGWNTMTAGGNTRCHTGNIDLRVGCQDIITANEKAGIFCSLEEFQVSVCRQDGLEAKPLVFVQVTFTPLFCDFGSLHIITIQDSLNFICIDIRKHRRAQQICYCTLTGTVWPCKDNNLRLFNRIIFHIDLFS